MLTHTHTPLLWYYTLFTVNEGSNLDSRCRGEVLSSRGGVLMPPVQTPHRGRRLPYLGPMTDSHQLSSSDRELRVTPRFSGRSPDEYCLPGRHAQLIREKERAAAPKHQQ